jgi:hypothetical protein
MGKLTLVVGVAWLIGCANEVESSPPVVEQAQTGPTTYNCAALHPEKSDKVRAAACVALTFELSHDGQGINPADCTEQPTAVACQGALVVQDDGPVTLNGKLIGYRTNAPPCQVFGNELCVAE